MKLTWLGHSCFLITSGNSSLLIDPFEPGSVPGYSKISQTVDGVLCTHQHFDHNYTPGAVIKEQPDLSPFHITEIPSYHDDRQGTLRGSNTIYLIEAEGIRLAHMGDIGCPLTQEQLNLLKNLKACLIPVGGTYTVNAEGAKQILDALSPEIVLPMHYRDGEYGLQDLECSLEDFTVLFHNRSFIYYRTNEMELTMDTPAHIAVLHQPA